MKKKVLLVIIADHKETSFALKGITTMISPEHILNTLKNWKIEMNSPYNDGWVQQSYKEKLSKVEEFFKPSLKHLDTAIKKMADPEALLAYENEIELYENYGGD